MIDINGAERYFAQGNHVESAAWAAFPPSARRGAVIQARRLLERALGRALKDDEADFNPGDTARDEFAVYEQALYILSHSRIYDAGSQAPYPTALNQVSDGIGGISREALRWF